MAPTSIKAVGNLNFMATRHYIVGRVTAYRTSGREEVEDRNRRARLSRWQFVVRGGIRSEWHWTVWPALLLPWGASLVYSLPAWDYVPYG